MNRVVTLVCLVGLAFVGMAVTPRDAHAQPKKKVAVLGLELKDDGSGIDERSANIARLLTEALRRRAKQPNGPYNLSPGSDKELVDAVLLAGCGSPDKDCMVKIGADMVADFLIYGKMEKQGKGFQVTLTLLDVGAKANVRTLSDIIPSGDTGDIALERWGKSLYARLAGESNKGAVRVVANVDSGQVFIDGQPKGNLVKGQARIAGLDEGKFKLRVESDGAIKEQSITINGGETTEVDIKLTPRADLGTGNTGGVVGPGDTTGTGFTGTTEGTISGPKPGGFWRKTAIASGIVAVAAGATWYYSYTKINDANDKLCLDATDTSCVLPGAAGSAERADHISKYNDQGNKFKKVTWVAAPLTIAAGGLFVFSVVRGFIMPGSATPSEAPGTIVLHRHGKTKVTLTPVVTPEAGAATVRIDW
jgi:hypothetical protein